MATLYPALYCLFVWWFSTGLIVFLNNLPRPSFRWSFGAATVLAAVALQRLVASSHTATVTDAYAAFTYGVLVWGWHEMAFFMGFVTGPRRVAAAPGLVGWQHFRAGVAACLWHELAILATGVFVVAACRGAPNQVGVWTFLALWGMRQSAKLNMFLGVLNLGEVFLPPHLAYLVSFMRRRRMNWLMPVSLAGGSVVVALLVRRIAAGVSPFEAAGLICITTMLGLAVLEHALLVLPLPYTVLWSTWLRLSGREAPAMAEPVPEASEARVLALAPPAWARGLERFDLSPAKPAV